MSFIKRIIGPDEKLVGWSTVHWIYGVKGIAWLAGFMVFGLFLQGLIHAELASPDGFVNIPAFYVLGVYAFWTSTLIGALLFLFYLVVMISTEIALTSKRVVFKRGLIAVDVREVDIEEIKAADVDNGWFGRFLNYGYILLDARFVANIQLPAIGEPYRFVKALNQMRAQVKHDSMRVILDEGADVEVLEERKAKVRHNEITNVPAHKRVQHLRPVVFSKVGLRQKVKDSFHTIAHYGNKY